METSTIENLIRTIPNFPKPGIMFRDITTLLLDANGFKETVDRLCAQYKDKNVTKVVAIESRGFLFGGALAYQLGAGLVIARKPGKLPAAVETQEYELEYGTDCIEIHKDAIQPGDRCLIVDDLIATGGTAKATTDVIKKLGGEVMGCGFIVNLPALKGADKLAGMEVSWLVAFDGD